MRKLRCFKFKHFHLPFAKIKKTKKYPLSLLVKDKESRGAEKRGASFLFIFYLFFSDY